MTDASGSGWLRHSRGLVLSLADQGVFSGSNLAIGLLLARWLDPAAYGTFAVAFAGLLFASGFHNALILEPMAVHGSRVTVASQGGYVMEVVALHVLVTVPAAGAILTAVALGALVMPSAVAVALIGMAVSLPFALLFWLMRGACYVRSRPGLALAGSTTYGMVVLILLASRAAFGDRTEPAEAFIIMGIGGLAGSAALWGPLGLSFGHLRRLDPSILKHRVSGHWQYGRWVVPTAIANGVGSLAYPPVIATSLGLAEAGAYRAAQNFHQPLQQALTATGHLFLPRMVLSRESVHGAQGSAVGRTLVIGCLIAAAVYGGGLLALGADLFRLVYGAAYSHFTWTIPWLAAAGIPAAASLALGTILRARHRPQSILWAKLASSLVLVAGLPVIQGWGLRGAFAVMLAGAGAEASVLAASIACSRRRLSLGRAFARRLSAESIEDRD